jgi:rubrerythrin
MTDYTDLVHILRQLNLKYGDMAADAIEEQAKEIKRLRKYEWIVKFIHSEPYELSLEKITNQRDYWKQMAKKLIEDESND